jgi:hypothetical protein
MGEKPESGNTSLIGLPKGLKNWAEIKVRVNQLRLPSGNRLTVMERFIPQPPDRGA